MQHKANEDLHHFTLKQYDEVHFVLYVDQFYVWDNTTNRQSP